MTEENTKQPDSNAQAVDKEIEADIRHLKRSSNLLAALGLVIIVLFIILLGIKVTHSWHPSEKVLPHFIESATVLAETTELLADPLPTAKVLAKLPRDTRLLIMNDNRKNWYKVHVVSADSDSINGLEGYLPKDEVRSRSQERQMRQELADQNTKAIDIVDVDWTIDEVGNYTISGKVVNLTKDLPLRNIKVIITFYDQDNNVVEQRSTIVATDNPLMHNNPIPFAFIGKNDKVFNFVNCRADYRFSADQ
ncbi:MAG: hypothetical protein P9L99_04050 [Candidatus Lernaella stagnicola]|nr:hypothetical protein [Candidatus Lernaella stagnicola]